VSLPDRLLIQTPRLRLSFREIPAKALGISATEGHLDNKSASNTYVEFFTETYSTAYFVSVSM
jgi:hypothetical protein